MPESEKSSSKRPNLYKPNDPPLFSFQITNPITYFKLWFKKVWAHEGIILHLRIRPLTIIVVALLLAGTSFGVSKYFTSFLPFEVFPEENPTPQPTPIPSQTPDPWIQTAYAGSLHKTDNKFYLIISSGEAISLEIPQSINLSTLIGKRVLASGDLNLLTKTLKVTDASDIEILPTKTVPIPSSAVSPAPTINPGPSIPPLSPAPAPTQPNPTPTQTASPTPQST